MKIIDYIKSGRFNRFDNDNYKLNKSIEINIKILEIQKLRLEKQIQELKRYKDFINENNDKENN